MSCSHKILKSKRSIEIDTIDNNRLVNKTYLVKPLTIEESTVITETEISQARNKLKRFTLDSKPPGPTQTNTLKQLSELKEQTSRSHKHSSILENNNAGREDGLSVQDLSMITANKTQIEPKEDQFNTVLYKKVTFDWGGYYEGEWINGLPDGYGSAQDKAGVYYRGEWYKGAKHGKGEEDYPKGGTYEGDFLDGRRHGRGVLHSSNGVVYSGDFFHDRMTGRGKISIYYLIKPSTSLNLALVEF